MFLKLLILSIIFIAIAAVGFGITMIIKKKGRFPETHVSRNPAMREKGITCAQRTDTGCHSSDGFPGCSCEGSRLKAEG